MGFKKVLAAGALAVGIAVSTTCDNQKPQSEVINQEPALEAIVAETPVVVTSPSQYTPGTQPIVYQIATNPEDIVDFLENRGAEIYSTADGYKVILPPETPNQKGLELSISRMTNGYNVEILNSKGGKDPKKVGEITLGFSLFLPYKESGELDKNNPRCALDVYERTPSTSPNNSLRVSYFITDEGCKISVDEVTRTEHDVGGIAVRLLEGKSYQIKTSEVGQSDPRIERANTSYMDWLRKLGILQQVQNKKVSEVTPDPYQNPNQILNPHMYRENGTLRIAPTKLKL